MSSRAGTGLAPVLSGGPVGSEVKLRKVPLLFLPFGNYMWIQRTAHTIAILHCYHLLNVSLLVSEVLRSRARQWWKATRPDLVPSPDLGGQAQPVRCNQNPDSSNHAWGSCGKENTNKKEEKVYSYASTMKKGQEQLTWASCSQNKKR